MSNSEGPAERDGIVPGNNDEGDSPAAKRRAAISRPYPRRTLEDAIRIPQAIKENNGGNPWPPGQVSAALGMGKSSTFYYLSASSRDFGFTEGTTNTATISLTDLGRRAVYPKSTEDELAARREGFFRVELFSKIIDHFGGSKLPEKRFLSNTLESDFGLDPRLHDEFIELFEKNCRFLGISADFSKGESIERVEVAHQASATLPVKIAQTPVDGESAEKPVCFVIMPFSERDESRPIGFFEEVFSNLFKPAIIAAGFVPRTAKRQGSDVIHSTIVTELLAADLVLADLTEHNPNVLFELGMRMAVDKPVALVRAKGTGPIFDVDNMLRVEDYNPNLWASTVEKDLPRLQQHVMATWENKDTEQTFLRILRGNSSAR